MYKQAIQFCLKHCNFVQPNCKSFPTIQQFHPCNASVLLCLLVTLFKHHIVLYAYDILLFFINC